MWMNMKVSIHMSGFSIDRDPHDHFVDKYIQEQNTIQFP